MPGALIRSILAWHFVLPDKARVRDLQCDVPFKIQQTAAIYDRVRYIEADTDVRVRENRAVLHHRPVVDMAITLNIAASGNQTLSRDFCSAPDECGCDDAAIPVHLGSVVHPNSRSGLRTERPQAATRSEAVYGEPAQICATLKSIDVASRKIPGRRGRTESLPNVQALRDPIRIDYPDV